MREWTVGTTFLDSLRIEYVDSFRFTRMYGEERRLKKFDEKEFFFRGGIIYFFSLEV